MQNKSVKRKPPEVLYQYRPPTVWAIANLARRVMYFTPPEQFNDPYDCSLSPKLDYLTGAKYAAFRKALPKFVSGKELDSFDGLSKTEAVDRFNAIIAERWSVIPKSRGVACFSERKDSLPMWSHYAGRGEGFCLAFEVEEIDDDLFLFENDEVAPVEYIDKIPAVESMKKWKNDKSLDKLLLYKSKEWEYEHEWRVIGARGEKKYYGELLKAVYFGTRAEDSTKELIRSIVEEIYPYAELWQGQLSKTEYKVEFDRIR